MLRGQSLSLGKKKSLLQAAQLGKDLGWVGGTECVVKCGCGWPMASSISSISCVASLHCASVFPSVKWGDDRTV